MCDNCPESREEYVIMQKVKGRFVGMPIRRAYHGLSHMKHLELLLLHSGRDARLPRGLSSSQQNVLVPILWRETN